jgi:hypothetical protein
MKSILRVTIVLAAIVAATCAWAASFTDGNLVVFRMGTGVAGSLTNAGSVVWLDEYTTNGVLIQSVMMPTNYFGANSPLLANGTAFGNGLITRSVDGRFIVVAGYGAEPGDSSSSLGTSYATQVPRVIGLVGGNGNIDTTTTLTNNASGGSSGGETRGAASPEGTNFWTGGDSLSGGGVQITSLGSVDATNLFGFNTRQVQIISNQLYLTGANFGGIGATGSIGIATNSLGTTLPYVNSNAFVYAFAPASSNIVSAEGFALFKLNAGGSDPLDTMYILDAGSLTSGAAKYSLVGGQWVYNGTLQAPASLVGLTANVIVPSPGVTNVNLYLSGGGSTLTGGDGVYKVTDPTGYNGDPSAYFQFSAFIGGTPNKSFRGIAFAPVGGVGTLSGAGNISVGPVVGLFANGDTGCALSSSSATQTYSIANLGTTGPITWGANCPSNWVTVNPSSGSLPSGGSVTVQAYFNGNVTSLPGSLDGVTNLTTIVFTNATSHIGDTTRAVRLIQRDQDLTPSTDYTVNGQPGGPFSPLGKTYTVFNGGTPITLTAFITNAWANVVVGTTTGSSVSVSLAACSRTNIAVTLITNGVGGANSLAAGFYTGLITFSNNTTVIDTRNVNLTVGGIYFCDNFSTFTQNTALEGQQGWVALNANPTLTVSNGAAWQPASLSAFDEPYKNIPLTTNAGVNAYVAMSMVVTSAPPLSTASPARGPTFFTAQNEGGFARDYLSARDTGTGTFVFALRKNGAGNSWSFGTNALSYGTKYNVIVQVDAGPTDAYMLLYVNPSGPPVNTNTAYWGVKNVGALDAGVGSYSLQGQFTTATIPSPGYGVYTLCITTNATEAYNDLPSAPPADSYSAWATTYGLTGGNALGTADPDGDGMNNTNEFLAGFNPTNSSARLKIISIARTDGTNNTITYLGASGDTSGSPGPKTNVLDFTTGTPPSYTNNFVSTGQTNVLTGGTGLGQTATFVDTNGASGPAKYYRVRVLVP